MSKALTTINDLENHYKNKPVNLVLPVVEDFNKEVRFYSTPQGLLQTVIISLGCTRSYSNSIPSGLIEIVYNPGGIEFE